MADEAEGIDYRHLFRILPGPYIVVRADDPDFTIVDENEAHAKLALTKRSQVIGRPVLSAFPDTSEQYQTSGESNLLESFRRVIKTGRPDALPVLPYDLRDGDGVLVNKVWRVTHYPVTDKAGAVRFIFQATEDITEYTQAEAERETANSMFHALFESTILAVVEADMEGNILQANRTFLKTFGYTAADLKRGMTSAMVTPPHARSLTARIYDSLRRTGEMQPVEKEYVRKDGSSVPMLVGAALQPGRRDRFIAFMLDISENKRLSALNVAKDEFIALASHQLRTPATAVKQYLGILIDGFAGPVSAQQKDFLLTAYNSNERQLTIINDLLKTAQLDSRGYALQRQTTNLVTMIGRIIKDFEPVLQARSQQLQFTHQASTVVATIDANELQLALSNLIENASKYTPDGKQIGVTLQRTDHHITITVSDEGVGIAKQDIGLIFEKFTRINNPLSDTVDGSGLGLYWVKRIVDLHGGTLRVKSVLKQGTTFTIGLPA